MAKSREWEKYLGAKTLNEQSKIAQSNNLNEINVYPKPLKEKILPVDFPIPDKEKLETMLGFRVNSPEWKEACGRFLESFTRDKYIGIAYPQSESPLSRHYLENLLLDRLNAWKDYFGISRMQWMLVENKFVWQDSNYAIARESGHQDLIQGINAKGSEFSDEYAKVKLLQSENDIGNFFARVLDLGQNAPRALRSLAQDIESIYESNESKYKELPRELPKNNYSQTVIFHLHIELINGILEKIREPEPEFESEISRWEWISQNHNWEEANVVYPDELLVAAIEAYDNRVGSEGNYLICGENLRRTLNSIGLGALPKAKTWQGWPPS